ncbi:MAG: hypothetical protein Q8P50_09080, partial [Bacillota bacterium]|nr:hypothetical protein [Bacillota bacterium]
RPWMPLGGMGVEEAKDSGDVLGRGIVDRLREVETLERGVRRSSRKMLGSIPSGDLRALRGGLADWSQGLRALADRVSLAEQALSGYTVPSEDPEFLSRYAEAIEQYVARAGILLEGRFPQYVAFPIDISIDLGRELARVNNRQVNVLDPKALSDIIISEYRKTHAAAFNGQRFMRALSTAYDLMSNMRKGSVTAAGQKPLKKIHELLTMRTGPSAYSLRQFAFDIYRLRSTTDLTYGGRRLSFVNTRRASDVVAVPTSPGHYENLGYLEMVPVEGDLIE